jgi:hypothetical protein
MFRSSMAWRRRKQASRTLQALHAFIKQHLLILGSRIIKKKAKHRPGPPRRPSAASLLRGRKAKRESLLNTHIPAAQTSDISEWVDHTIKAMQAGTKHTLKATKAIEDRQGDISMTTGRDVELSP